ncbi:MAG TPA: hypothetical protein VFA34_15730 [Actinomycetota bacterium]|jgi:hypothetical protein|nr:hypothetical protein [Actinomycetota bacterium]
MPDRPAQYSAADAGPGPLARLVAFVVSAGLAWAIVLAVVAWLLGLVFARG